MEQRWGLPLIAWPSRLRPNLWDLVALPIVLGAIALIAWGGMAMSARYQIGEVLPISLDPWQLPAYALRTVLRMVCALVASLVFSLVYAAVAAKTRQGEKILIPILDILHSVTLLGCLAISAGGGCSVLRSEATHVPGQTMILPGYAHYIAGTRNQRNLATIGCAVLVMF